MDLSENSQMLKKALNALKMHLFRIRQSSNQIRKRLKGLSLVFTYSPLHFFVVFVSKNHVFSRKMFPNTTDISFFLS